MSEKGFWNVGSRANDKSGKKMKKRLSIITVCYNSQEHLEETIRSVIGQLCPLDEYIVVDGGSSDGTMDIIKQYERHLSRWVSEPDRGVSHAFNKGIAMASGDVVGIINSDDYYAPQSFEKVTSSCASSSFGFFFGGCTYLHPDGSQKYMGPDRTYHRKIRLFMPHIHHPTVFVKRALYEKYGGFDESLHYAMDYDFLLRLHRNGIRGRALETNLAFMRLGGRSTSDYMAVRREVRGISNRHGAPRVLTFALFWLFLFKYGLSTGHRKDAVV